MLVLATICVILILAIVVWAFEYWRNFKEIWRIPAPKGIVPFFGHMFHITGPEEFYFDPYRMTIEYGEGKWLRGCLGFYYCLNIADPEILEHIMTHSDAINKSRLYSFLHKWLGTGLLTSSGNKWRSRRKLLTPCYHFKILEQFVDVFDRNSNILVEKLQTEVGNPSTNVFPYITLCALDTICETAMGTSVNAQVKSDSDYVIATKEMSRIMLSRTVSLIKQIDFLYKFTEDYRKETKALKTLHEYTISVINHRRKVLLAKTKEVRPADDEGTLGYREKIPFLDLLLQATLNGESLSDEDILEEVDTFMFEGHDTTSAAMSFFLYCIAQNPMEQDKILEEQRKIYAQEPERETTYQDLQEMRYLEMAIKETLRLYPSVPLFGRTITEDLHYKDLVIKKGTEVSFGVYTMHRNPEFYPNPDHFNPERFTPEKQAARHPFAYLPFSAGHRNCVGQKFAMLEMKATLGKLVRHFVFTHVADSTPQLKSGIILISANGINIKINRRRW